MCGGGTTLVEWKAASATARETVPPRPTPVAQEVFIGGVPEDMQLPQLLAMLESTGVDGESRPLLLPPLAGLLAPWSALRAATRLASSTALLCVPPCRGAFTMQPHQHLPGHPAPQC